MISTLLHVITHYRRSVTLDTFEQEHYRTRIIGFDPLIVKCVLFS